MPTVLGYRPTEQGHHDYCHEPERGKHELKEDVAMFDPTEPSGNGTPIPYLVNPQSDTTPPIRAHQTAKRAIDFTRRSDFWMDNASSPQRHRLTAAEQRRWVFRYDDGRQIAASSEASMLTFIAEPIHPNHFACLQQEERLRQEAMDSRPKTSAAMGEEKKKEGEGDECMDQDVKQVDSQDKDATGGEDKEGGSGTMA